MAQHRQLKTPFAKLTVFKRGKGERGSLHYAAKGSEAPLHQTNQTKGLAVFFSSDDWACS